MEIRICANGHQVPQEFLKACPACGASLAGTEFVEVDELVEESTVATPRVVDEDPIAPVPEFISGLPSGLIFVVLGIVLGLIGWLSAVGADGRGVAAGASVLLLWASGILTSIGVIAIGVKLGVEDARGV